MTWRGGNPAQGIGGRESPGRLKHVQPPVLTYRSSTGVIQTVLEGLCEILGEIQANRSLTLYLNWSVMKNRPP